MNLLFSIDLDFNQTEHFGAGHLQNIQLYQEDNFNKLRSSPKDNN